MSKPNLPRYAQPLADLRRLSDEELEEHHDWHARETNVPVRVEYFLDELARRESRRRTDTMVRLTEVITVLTAVNIVMVLLSLFVK
jgi:hypothetical protein